MKAGVKTIASQPSWVIRSSDVELAVTQLGGHMGPVTFYRRSAKPVRPYWINPWCNEKQKIDEPVLVPGRGDFFCAPFGANAVPWRGEKHPCHGETATSRWKLVGAEGSGARTTLTLSMRTKIRPGKATKRLTLVEGQNVVYSTDTLEGFSGAMPMGHHATLAVPEKEGTLRVATSPIRFGRTYPLLFSHPPNREYQSLAIDKRFSDLSRVPLIWAGGGLADCTSFPAREGYTDLIAVFNKPGKQPAWTAATFTERGYLWFSLKDPSVLPTTAMWISNRGRHGPPWNGRNRCIGLEDVCAYFAEGLAASLRPNALNKAGIPTAIKLSRSRPTAINYIQGAVKVPRGFGRVKSAKFGPSRVTFISQTGKRATAKVDHEFLTTGQICD